MVLARRIGDIVRYVVLRVVIHAAARPGPLASRRSTRSAPGASETSGNCKRSSPRFGRSRRDLDYGDYAIRGA